MSKKLNILALDVATSTGWCTATASGTWSLGAKRDESKGMRLIRMKAKLREVVDAEQIDVLVFERSQGRNQNAVIVQSELHGVVKLFCEENQLEYRAYSPKEIKLAATGKGNASKQAMIDACVSKYNHTPIDDNEADAIHMWHLAQSDYGNV